MWLCSVCYMCSGLSTIFQFSLDIPLFGLLATPEMSTSTTGTCTVDANDKRLGDKFSKQARSEKSLAVGGQSTDERFPICRNGFQVPTSQLTTRMYGVRSRAIIHFDATGDSEMNFFHDGDDVYEEIITHDGCVGVHHCCPTHGSEQCLCRSTFETADSMEHDAGTILVLIARIQSTTTRRTTEGDCQT